MRFAFAVIALAALGCGSSKKSDCGPEPAKITSLEVTPASGTLPVNRTLQLRALGRACDGSSSDLTGSATWESQSPSALTIDARGLARAAAGAAPGATSVVRATSGTLTGSSAVTVAAGAPTFSVLTTDDPLVSGQWNLLNTGQAAWADVGGTAGEDLNVEPVYSTLGIEGRGVRVAVVDTGLEVAHEDLATSVVRAECWDFRSRSSTIGNLEPLGDHGTSVASLIAMVRGNGKGGMGVAPGVELVGYRVDGLDGSGSEADLVAATGGSSRSPNSASVWIFNKSFGTLTPTPAFDAQAAVGARTLRGGLGAIYVQAAGNNFAATEYSPGAYCPAARRNGLPCLGSYWHSHLALPYNIVVGALSASGRRAFYSSSGGSLWVATPGGHIGANAAVYGSLSPPAFWGMLPPEPGPWLYEAGLVNADLMGCNRGLARNVAPLDFVWTRFASGAAPNEGCNYISDGTGTSAAAPVAAGAVALLLEANPALSWRDVKHLLASTARRVDSAVAPIVISPTNGTWVAEPGWTTNAAGYAFHNWYGFGAIDAAAAVQAALAYPYGQLGEFQETAWIATTTLSTAIPDDDASGAAATISVTDALVVESVVASLTLSHSKSSELGVELVSPAGTRSVLKAPVDGLSRSLSGMPLATNAFYGEGAAGTWTIRVVDVNDPAPPAPPAAGTCDGTAEQPDACRFQSTNTAGGTLTGASIKIYGHAVASPGGLAPAAPSARALQAPPGPRRATPATTWRYPSLAARIDSAPRGAALGPIGSSWSHLADARAVPLLSGERVADLLAALNLTRADILEQKGRWVILRTGRHAPPRLERLGDRAALPVALEAGGQLAFAPGTLRIVPRQGADAEAIAARAGLGLRRSFPELGVTFLDVPEGQDLAEAATRVRSDVDVLAAEVELVEYPIALF